MSRCATYFPQPLPHERAPAGAPDKYVTTKPVHFRWWGVSKKLLRGFPVGTIVIDIPGSCCPKSTLTHSVHRGVHFLDLHIPLKFYFAVSIAPSFPRARPGACLHDWIYKCAEFLAEATGLSVRHILHIADRWFLAQLSTSGFLLSRTYFVFVRIFGYYFHKLFSRN